VLELRGGTEESATDPYSIFLFAMRSPKTREKCTGRLRMFFDFIGIRSFNDNMSNSIRYSNTGDAQYGQ
jgi:hypothetical protein